VPALARVESHDLIEVGFTVNGTPAQPRVAARVTLSDVLRDQLGLTGTHVGCEHGVCGMCTVLLDGAAVRACLVFAVQLQGSEITTVEALGRPDQLHPLQEAFSRHHGLQCGFCTPGFLMSAFDLLSHRPDVTRAELPNELSGVLCRCTGYRNIIDAVDDVACAYREGLPGPGNCNSGRSLVGRNAAGPVSTPQDPVGNQETDADGGGLHTIDAIRLPTSEPTVTITVDRQIGATMDGVARVFSDVQLMARCLPGAQLTDDLGGGRYAGRATIGLGPVKLSFRGVAQIVDQQRDRITILAQGRDAGGSGAQAQFSLAAEPSAEGARLTADAQMFLTGRIAGFGRSLAGDVSRRMFADFAAAIEQAARGEEPVAAEPPSAARLLTAALASRMSAWWAAARSRIARRGAGVQNSDDR
jgi:carbon-monoxide dehydrogenase small subunit